MHKKLLAVPMAAILSMGLTGCGTNEDAGVERSNEIGQPMGYYSNENHGSRGGNARVEDGTDNDGPLTEMMDHTLGGEGEKTRHNQADNNARRVRNENTGNPTIPIADRDRSFFMKDNRFSHSDANYHGHLDDNTRQAKNSYYQAYEGELAEKIGDVAASVPNVEDVRSVTYGSNVLIAVDLTDYDMEEETKKAIHEAVEPYLRGRSAKVVTDEGTFSRLRNIDNNLRDGGPREQIDWDLKNLFRREK
ncbi:YhcN/YlaJ family sporulation lipoprotein [Bacillus sp. 7894-2]|uniref:YhcN/YlaJ family sporulation lipoprotein n=1 Tax=Bacillus sp. 7894-2 TaxID=2021695 RepID=UPI000BA6E864|nr:YhcN/YlaJ family sporulation lipoprotein [Bacillus sp. 7894-2]PAE23036.1 spore cortex protein CoxA [Bacillus sp. 7894-2]